MLYKQLERDKYRHKINLRRCVRCYALCLFLLSKARLHKGDQGVYGLDLVFPIGCYLNFRICL